MYRNLENKECLAVSDILNKIQCDVTCTRSFKCAVVNCKNRYKSNQIQHFKFHKFPNFTANWLLRCKLLLTTATDNMFVCTNHFLISDYEIDYTKLQDPNYMIYLKEDAVPSRNLEPVTVNLCDSVLRPKLVEEEIIEAKAEHIEALTNINLCDMSNLMQSCVEDKSCEIQKSPKRDITIEHIRELMEINEALKLEKAKMDLEKDQLTNSINQLNTKYAETRRKLKSVERMTKQLMLPRPKRQKNSLRSVFSEAQINVLKGRRAYWSNDDLAMAFTLRHMGNKELYLYIKNTLNIPLPALSCVQKWATSKD